MPWHYIVYPFTAVFLHSLMNLGIPFALPSFYISCVPVILLTAFRFFCLLCALVCCFCSELVLVLFAYLLAAYSRTIPFTRAPQATSWPSNIPQSAFKILASFVMWVSMPLFSPAPIHFSATIFGPCFLLKSACVFSMVLFSNEEVIFP